MSELTPTEQAKAAYEAAQTARDAAKKKLEDLKAGHEGVVKAFKDAKAAYDALSPATTVAKAELQKADADVTLTRAAYAALAPKEVAAESKAKGAGNAALLAAVVKVLADKPEGLSNDQIFDAVKAQGLELAGAKPRDNFNAYLSRWGTAGQIVNLGVGKWGPVTATPPAAPGFLTPPADANQPVEQTPPAPGFLAPPASDDLTAEFPGFEPLRDAGYTTKASLAGKSAEDLTAIAGIGAKTAGRILEALAG